MLQFKTVLIKQLTPVETRPSKMEIYHRDHWIIIVHIAIWKDFNKWNEENTKIGLDQSYGEDRQACDSCAFAPSARRQCVWKRWDSILYTISYLSISSLRLQVPGCARLFLAVVGCTWLYQAVFGYTWLNLALLGCTWLNLAVLGCPWLSLAVLGCNQLNLATLGSTWLNLSVPGCPWL